MTIDLLGLEQLYITDGTKANTIDVLKDFSLKQWERSIQDLKGGGIWQDSQLEDNRQLVDFRYATAIEEMLFDSCANDGNTLAGNFQELRRVLIRARGYWLHSKRIRPVYIIRKFKTEKVPRYALIHNWVTPTDTSIVQKRDSILRRGISATDFSVLIERSAWRKQPPGIGECLPIYREASNRDPAESMMDFTDESAYADRVYNANLDITGSNFALDGWIKFEWEKAISVDDGGWLMSMHPTSLGSHKGYFIKITESYFTGVISLSAWFMQDDGGFNQGWEIHSWILPESLRNEWFHFSISRTTGVLGELRINGILNTDSNFQNDGYPYSPGNLNFTLGNSTTHNVSANLKMAWIRLFNTAYWWNDPDPVSFEARCDDPDITLGPGAVVAAWKHQIGAGTTLEDLGGTYNLGMSDITTFTECDEPIGNVEDVADCFGGTLANGSGGGIDFVFNYDSSAGTWSANLVGNLPINIFPDPCGVGDGFYVGSLSAPIDVLTVNIERPNPGTIPINILIYTGAVWDNVGADVTDETNTFLNTGVNRIYYNGLVQGKTTVNGITAYWLWFDVAAGGPFTPPLTAFDHLRVNNQNWIEFKDAGGDIGVETQINLLPKYAGELAGEQLNTVRMIAGLRSLDEHPNFRSALNFSDVYVGADGVTAQNLLGSFADYIYAPTGRVVEWTGSPGIEFPVCSITVSADVANQFMGRFNVFLRTETHRNDAAIVEGQFTVRAVIRELGEALQIGPSYLTGVQDFPQADNLGILEIPFRDPGVLPLSQDVARFNITIYATCHVAGRIRVVDLHLIPADEMYIDTYTNSDYRGAYYEYPFETGSIKTLRRNLISQIFEPGRTPLFDQFDYYAQRRFMINSKGRQALFFLFITNDYDFTYTAGEYNFSEPRIHYFAETEGNQLYLSAIAEGE